MKNILFLILFVLLVGFVKTIYQYISVSGVLTNHEPTLADKCEKVLLAKDAQFSLGTEDIVIDRDTGLVMVSAMNRFEYATENQSPVDGIYGFRLGADGTSSIDQLTLLSVDAPANFHPHGISFWQGITREGVYEKRLFVVNHRSHTDKAIEIFRVTEDLGLRHLKTVSSPEIYSPNDVAAVSEDSFYVSNDSSRSRGLRKTIERFLFLPLTNIVFYDGEKAYEVAKHLVYANGLAVNTGFSKIYLAEPPAQRIKVFKRLADNSLSYAKTIKLNTAPDNIDFAPDGSLWTGAHPKLIEYLRYSWKQKQIAPSHVVRINPDSGKASTILFTENGELSASSTAATYAGRLLVGSVYEGAILNCPYP